MKFALPYLKFPQRDKLADFAVNFAVAWFVASIITPFLTLQDLTIPDIFRMLLGVVTGLGFLYFSLYTVRKE